MVRFIQATKYGNMDDWMYRPDDWLPLHLRFTAGFAENFKNWWSAVDAD